MRTTRSLLSPSLLRAVLASLALVSCASSSQEDTANHPQRPYIPVTPGAAPATDAPAETIGGKGRSEDAVKPVVMTQAALPPPPPHIATPHVRPPPR